MKTRDSFCVKKDILPLTEEEPVVVERKVLIANAKGDLLYHKVISLANNPDVSFSNGTVGDLARAYRQASRKLKRATRKLEEERDISEKLAAFLAHAPALLEVFDHLYENLPDCTEDIAVQRLVEASDAGDELRKLLAEI